MKNTLILVASLCLFGCAKKFPEYPKNLREFHLIEVIGQPMDQNFVSHLKNLDDVPNPEPGQVVRCMDFKVTHVNPYEFKFTEVVPLTECHQVAGYKPEENVLLWNWIDDVLHKIDEKSTPL